MALITIGDLVIDVAAATGMNFILLMSLIWIQTNHFVNMVLITNYWFFYRQCYSCLQKYWQTCTGLGKWQGVVWGCSSSYDVYCSTTSTSSNPCANCKETKEGCCSKVASC
jgi:hypothetical protein